MLAVQKEGVPEYVTNSFLDETFLGDQKTPLREYLAANPEASSPELLVGLHVPHRGMPVRSVSRRTLTVTASTHAGQHT